VISTFSGNKPREITRELGSQMGMRCHRSFRVQIASDDACAGEVSKSGRAFKGHGLGQDGDPRPARISVVDAHIVKPEAARWAGGGYPASDLNAAFESAVAVPRGVFALPYLPSRTIAATTLSLRLAAFSAIRPLGETS